MNDSRVARVKKTYVNNALLWRRLRSSQDLVELVQPEKRAKQVKWNLRDSHQFHIIHLKAKLQNRDLRVSMILSKSRIIWIGLLLRNKYCIRDKIRPRKSAYRKSWKSRGNKFCSRCQSTIIGSIPRQSTKMKTWTKSSFPLRWYINSKKLMKNLRNRRTMNRTAKTHSRLAHHRVTKRTLKITTQRKHVKRSSRSKRSCTRRRLQNSNRIILKRKNKMKTRKLETWCWTQMKR